MCLETALARHGLSDAIPAAIDIAIPRGQARPVLHAPCRLHQFHLRTFDLGRERLDVGARTPIGIYSAEPSLVDVVRAECCSLPSVNVGQPVTSTYRATLSTTTRNRALHRAVQRLLRVRELRGATGAKIAAEIAQAR